jgi:hypothetical protein
MYNYYFIKAPGTRNDKLTNPKLECHEIRLPNPLNTYKYNHKFTSTTAYYYKDGVLTPKKRKVSGVNYNHTYYDTIEEALKTKTLLLLKEKKSLESLVKQATSDIALILSEVTPVQSSNPELFL